MTIRTTSLAIAGWIFLVMIVLLLKIPGPFLADGTEGGMFRTLLVFAPINLILLAACITGYLKDRDFFHQTYKYPYGVIGIWGLDMTALLVVLAAFTLGSGAFGEGSRYGEIFAIAGAFVLLSNIPLLANYLDVLSPTSKARTSVG